MSQVVIQHARVNNDSFILEEGEIGILNGDLVKIGDGVTTFKKRPAFMNYYGYSPSNYSPDVCKKVGIYGGAYTGPTGWPFAYSNNLMPFLFTIETGHTLYVQAPSDWDSMKTKVQICMSSTGDFAIRYKIPQTTGDVDSWNWSSWTIKNFNIIDSLTSTSTTSALSANQGKILNDKIEDIPVINVINNLTSTSTTSALSAAQGKNLNDNIPKYGTSSDTMSPHRVTCAGFVKKAGAIITVKFINGTFNDTSQTQSPSLNVNNTGNSVVAIGYHTSGDYMKGLESSSVRTFVFDGTYYQMIGNYPTT